MSFLSEIINIGDELLIGQVINSNAAYIASSLNSIGIDVEKNTVVPDKKETIITALDQALATSDLVVITGGLGPTNDDITKYTLCEYFGDRLVFSEEAFADIKKIFAARNFPMTEVNRQQAMLPEHCIQIPNSRGTARGMWFEQDGKVVISMPGVPFEMTEMMDSFVLKMLKQHFLGDFAIVHRTIMCTGAGESFLAEKIADWEAQLPPFLSLAYLPSPGIVRLRITGKNHDAMILEKAIQAEVTKLKALISEYIFAEKDISLEAFLVETLSERSLTLSTAESCTGGYIAHLLTTVSGSSKCFKGSVVAYCNEVKEALLDVPADILREHGAVSEPVVIKMAEHVRQKLQTDLGIAVSGIAGPTGAVEGKPVGTVWIAVSNGKSTFTECCHFGNDRIRNIQRSAMAALNLLRISYL